MKTVDILIGTSIKGPRRGLGRVMYIMKTKLKNGAEHESIPAIAEYEGTTESQLVLYGVRDALYHMNYACRLVIHTECSYIESAIQQAWPKEWERNNWKNSRGAEVKDSVLWSMILREVEEKGHELTVECGKHEYTEWFAWNLTIAGAMRDIFTAVSKS